MKEIFDTLLLDVTEGVAVVTIDRTDVRNAVDAAVRTDLRRALDLLVDADEVGTIVITGAGDRAFAAGADIGRLRDYTLHTGLRADLQRLFDDLEACPKPTIAAVNGYALGGGCELALACDVRIAAGTARFGLPEPALAVLPGAGGTQRMARLIGVGRTLELILTGRILDADQALAIGLVTAVVPAPDLLGHARALAARIAAQGPLAVRLAKLVVRAGLDADQRTGLVLERLAQALLYTTADKTEGTEAFLAKRSPHFTGS